MKTSVLLNKLFRFIFIILLVIVLYRLFNKSSLEGFENNVPNVAFPFKNIYDDANRKIPIICISAPFRSDEHKKLYETYKKQGYSFLGSSSYQEFPGTILNPYEDKYYSTHNDNYEANAKAWIHCFREPDKYFKTNVPRLLMSESDFIDPNRLIYNPNTSKKYDFIYVCLDEGAKHEATNCKPGWQAHNRNWELAKECLKVMCGEFKLKGLIMGRTNCDITEKCNNYISSLPFQPQEKFLELLQECKFIFVPNISDASPRVVTQAMCYNMPVLMNKNIVGGWKYVNNQTGVFFNDEKDISTALYEFLNKSSYFSPRKWFVNNYGKEKTGRRLLGFLKEHYGNVDFKDAEYATFKRL